MKRRRRALTLTVLNDYELGNALRFAEFRKAIAQSESALLLAYFETDKTAGRIQIHVCNLADVMIEANRLSATHTLMGGHRGFDILHVAAALVMGADQLLTFDTNQKKLALTEGLEVPI